MDVCKSNHCGVYHRQNIATKRTSLSVLCRAELWSGLDSNHALRQIGRRNVVALDRGDAAHLSCPWMLVVCPFGQFCLQTPPGRVPAVKPLFMVAHRGGTCVDGGQIRWRQHCCALGLYAVLGIGRFNVLYGYSRNVRWIYQRIKASTKPRPSVLPNIWTVLCHLYSRVLFVGAVGVVLCFCLDQRIL